MRSKSRFIKVRTLAKKCLGSIAIAIKVTKIVPFFSQKRTIEKRNSVLVENIHAIVASVLGPVYTYSTRRPVFHNYDIMSVFPNGHDRTSFLITYEYIPKGLLGVIVCQYRPGRGGNVLFFLDRNVINWALRFILKVIND